MGLCCYIQAIINIFWFFGIIKLVELGLRLFWFVRRQLRTTDHLPTRYGKGSWVLITGGTDGIGLAMANELARLSFNIVIVARNPDKLKRVETDLISKYKIKVQTIEFDFSKTIKPENYQRHIVEKVKDLDISILINNVGNLYPGVFEKVSLEHHKEQIDVNVIPATVLSKLLMDQMLNRPNKGRSAILFTTSVQVAALVAGSATYGASKIFVDYLSKALSHENRERMDCLTFQCGLVSTNFIGKQKKTLTCIRPDQAAYSALRDLGYEFQTNGHWIHEVHHHIVTKLTRFGGLKAQSWLATKSNMVYDKLYSGSSTESKKNQ